MILNKAPFLTSLLLGITIVSGAENSTDALIDNSTAIPETLVYDNSGSNSTNSTLEKGKKAKKQKNAGPTAPPIKPCMSIMNQGCMSYDSFVASLRPDKTTSSVCKVTSNFGPIISRCTNRGKYMFNHGLSIHGQSGSPIRSICPGRVSEVLTPKKGNPSVITRHKFGSKCTFNGKVYTDFEIIYGHTESIKGKGSTVRMSEQVSTLKQCAVCSGARVPHYLSLHINLVAGNVKTAVNPMAAFGVKRTQIVGKIGKESNGDMRVELKTPCKQPSLNRYEVRCGSSGYVLDLNVRHGFPTNQISTKPHTQNKNMPYLAPLTKAFDDTTQTWKTNFIVPRSWHKGNCCHVLVKDIWANGHYYVSTCQKQPGKGGKGKKRLRYRL